jgi:metallo-beta-lactamase class B
MLRKITLLSTAAVILPITACAQAESTLTRRYTADECSSCEAWNAPRAPFRIFGDTYYVGTDGLSAILIASDQGHVLIDGGIPESATVIAQNIQSLGFRVEDVELLLNSHAHFDHAGGIAALQAASGARVAASPASVPVLEQGASGPNDPQYGELVTFPPVSDVETIADGEVLRVGPIELTARFTPGHTPGGTSWSWRSCDDAGRCLDLVYADSQTPISADDFRYTDSATYPNALEDYDHGLTLLENIPCDLLLTPHPSASRLFERVAEGELIDSEGCRRYAANARDQVARRVESERR